MIVKIFVSPTKNFRTIFFLISDLTQFYNILQVRNTDALIYKIFKNISNYVYNIYIYI